MIPLKDTDLCPYGKFVDVPMQDVPVWWLHWIWEHGGKGDRFSPVADYIYRNLPALQDEDTDRIWSASTVARS